MEFLIGKMIPADENQVKALSIISTPHCFTDQTAYLLKVSALEDEWCVITN
jgi:hypothetical protein